VAESKKLRQLKETEKVMSKQREDMMKQAEASKSSSSSYSIEILWDMSEEAMKRFEVQWMRLQQQIADQEKAERAAFEYRTVEILREFGQDSKQPHALLDLKPGRDPI
jgi:hypothetical protein